ncbi:hypothetical protein AKJ09_06322 [Labilithrix luteola]|uniref:VIT domain-containing protein n=1 Tax=Labilithrix luteola TaxID=1391654 RepID=A0A0K1Q1K4_9BACT|nr:VIT domain-containing protein [Labilithrix luteola]AKU99658.1 hypothetical protein AKJ09_06322 [Labilithrix luteola]
MNEKTLLYGALSVTAIAAIYGVVKAREMRSTTSQSEITTVPVTDSPQRVEQAEVPIRLTASDGTGLKLSSLSAKAAVEDPLALTELHLVFENPENRVLEGTFRITLPQGASLSRFAMKVGSTWQEGEVVEKQAARQAYEDFLHRRQDPALMEQGAGNEFSARVFPIPARGTKEIIIAYSESLEAGAPYVLPLRGLPMLGTLDVDVHAAGSRNAIAGGRPDMTYSVHQQRITPAQDFVVEGKQIPRSNGLRNGDLAIARVVPFASSRPEPLTSAVVLVDTSASRGLGLGEEAKLVKNVLARLPKDANVVVGCFDQEVVSVYEGPAGGFGDKQVSEIVARGALGASDFERAIGWAGEQAKKAKAKRVVLVGDGVATAGETDAQKLRDRVEKLRDAGIERMDAVAIGGIRDDAFLRTIVRGVLDRDGVVLDAKLGADAVARRLGEATSSGVPVKVEGATWAWPEKLDGLQAGDEVMVYARLDANKPVAITVGTQQFTPDLRTIERPLVERAWAQAKIQSLIDAPTDNPSATKHEIVSLSTRHRVLSPHTAMLVLETDWDYQRFGIDRTATVDILTVDNGHASVAHNSRTQDGERTADLGGKNNREKAKGENADRKSRGAPTAEEPWAPSEQAANAPPALEAPAATATGAPAADQEQRPADVPTPMASAAAPAKGFAEQTAPPPPPAPVAQGTRGGSNQSSSLAEGLAAPMPVPTPTPRPATRAGDGPGHAASGGFGAGGAGGGGGGRARDTRTGTSVGSVQVRPNTLVVEQGISQDDAQRVVRGATPQLRACYTGATATDATLHGRFEVRVVIDAQGRVKAVQATQAPASETFKACALSVFRGLSFPAPGTGEAKFAASFDLVNLNGGTESDPQATRDPKLPAAAPYEGRFRIVMDKLSRGDKDDALGEAKQWQTEQPGDVLALVALGEAYEARGDAKTAARAYGSILELFSFRADSRRFAGERLERLHDPFALRLAADTYGKAAEQRPDHPASHRMYAYTLVKTGEYEKAFEALQKGVSRSYPPGRFLGAERILKEDLGLVAAAWAKAEPARRSEIMQKLHAAGGTEENGPSLRFVLAWETDANDVDFHIYDGRGGHAYYGEMRLPSGGALYADVTTGYGPECFTIRKAPSERAYPYKLQAHYYSRGPMGYGMGKLEIVEHDGRGGLSFEERPFVVMVDQAYVDLGTVEKKSDATALK